MFIALNTTNRRSPGKANRSVLAAAQKAQRWMQKAQAAKAAYETMGKRMRDETTALSAQQAAVAPPAPTRTSIKAFANKDPRQALAVLQCIDLSAMKAREYEQLDVVVHKYNVRTLSEALTIGDLYKSVPSASMMASMTVRYVFEVACELANNSEEYTEAKRALVWHEAQHMVKTHDTRGVGVVANSDAAMELLKQALVVAMTRVQERVAAADEYETAMDTTAAIVAGS